MDYVKLNLTKKGLVAYRVTKNGIAELLSTEGQPISPEYETLHVINGNASTPKWGGEQNLYEEVSLLSGSLDAYMGMDGKIYDVDGNVLTSRWLEQNGWTESFTIDKYPQRLDWMA